MQKEIEVLITGKVQMVMFRDFINNKAQFFGLYGTVENLDGGSILVVAQGDEDKLNKFIEKLKTGPQFAEIENVNVEWREIGEKFTDFKITWT